jgi:pimeloyl-ACP methyl ester carboxylesterase
VSGGRAARVITDPDRVAEPGRLGQAEGFIARAAEHWPRVDDGLQIRSGGAVAVDTSTLSEAAVRFDAVRGELADIAHGLRRLQAALALSEYGGDARAAASALGTRLDDAQTEAEEIAAALREAAYAYEMVELQAQHRAAVLAGDTDRATRLDARLSAMVDAHPTAWRIALGAEFGNAVLWPSELVRQATQWGTVVGDTFGDPGAIVAGVATGLLTLGGAAVVGLAGTGRIPRDARLTGGAGPVTVTPIAAAAPNTLVPAFAPGAAPGGAAAASTVAPPTPPSAVAPRSLAAVAERMPGAGDSRVRVERYTMPDGSRQYAVYIAGMQSYAAGGDDPWDNESNLQLYAGQRSDSYAATEAALAEAGVQPGDAVHVFGFSQGAMIGAHLALEGGYDTRTLVSIGSPVDPDVGSGTLSVALRHTDDPVAGLAGGGHGEAVGAAGSFVAERVADPESALEDAWLPAHRLTAYAETAALVDASSDPRVDGVREVFDTLGAAESVEVTEYAATRGEG